MSHTAYKVVWTEHDFGQRPFGINLHTTLKGAQKDIATATGQFRADPICMIQVDSKTWKRMNASNGDYCFVDERWHPGLTAIYTIEDDPKDK
jgi:hypothetical protein